MWSLLCDLDSATNGNIVSSVSSSCGKGGGLEKAKPVSNMVKSLEKNNAIPEWERNNIIRKVVKIHIHTYIHKKKINIMDGKLFGKYLLSKSVFYVKKRIFLQINTFQKGIIFNMFLHEQ